MTSPFDMPLGCFSPAAFLGTGFDFIELVRRPEVADKWFEPSACREMTVGAVAAHGLSNLEVVLLECERPEPATARLLGIVEYGRPMRLNQPEDFDDLPGFRMIAQQSEALAADGPARVIERAEAWLEHLRWVLPAMDPDKHVYLPRLPPMAGSLSMTLANRTNELVVHMDDVAVSVGLPTPPIRPEAAAMALTVLTSLSRYANSDLELIRVMARSERAKPDKVRAI
jgi:hypothetical protein